MNEVVNRNRPRVQLSLREVTTAAVEQREVRANSEIGDLPVTRVDDRADSEPSQQDRCQGGVGESAGSAARRDGGSCSWEVL